MTTRPHWSKSLKRLSACTKAVKWARRQPGPATAWSKCRRGDWMLWYAFTVIGPTRDTRVGRALWNALADCATSVLHLHEQRHPGDTRVRDCIDGIRAYAKGKMRLTA